MSLLHLMKHARTLAPHVAAARGWRFAWRILRAHGRQVLDRSRETYAPAGTEPPPLHGRVREIAAGLLAPHAETIAGLAANTLEHRFDLLGSGWVRVEHGMECAGFGGHRYPPRLAAMATADRAPLVRLLSPGNRKRARTLWALADADYRPIDWQVDFKSGHRWAERRVSGSLGYGHRPGVDIKVPWELARLQHLPQLAWAFILARAGSSGFEAAETYRAEFQNQVIDFAAANPPGFGVNWFCAMDVGIRAANLVLAGDLFRRHGGAFDAAFEAEFAALLHAHGRFIAGNLEWHATDRGNHYLADIAGLLFAAATGARTPEGDCWLAFAVRELVAESARQFTPDGANFEASTSYHRLSAEMVAYGTALVLGLPDDKMAALAEYDHRQWRHRPPLAPGPVEMHPLPGGADGEKSPFPAQHFERLQRMAEFTMHATKPNGRVVQVGDNDSGRFFKLFPVCKTTTAAGARTTYANLAGYRGLADGQPYLDEDILDHRETVAAINGLFARDDLAAFAGAGGGAVTALVAGLAGERKAAATMAPGRQAENVDPVARDGGREIVIVPPDATVLAELSAVSYPDFGLYIWRSPRFFLSLLCAGEGRNGTGAHAHNDQLAMELNIDGEDWIADPGTGVYTADPALRNAYRSIQAHAAPGAAGAEPERLDLGLFRLEDRARARCLGFDKTTFSGEYAGHGASVRRTVVIEPGRIVVRDSGPGIAGGTVTVRDAAALRGLLGPAPAFSPGYGKILARPAAG